jgi:hypothetical protein
LPGAEAQPIQSNPLPKKINSNFSATSVDSSCGDVQLAVVDCRDGGGSGGGSVVVVAAAADSYARVRSSFPCDLYYLLCPSTNRYHQPYSK